MEVPFFSLAKQNVLLKAKLLSSFAELIDRGDFVLGKDLGRFEVDFALYCNSNFALGLSNGTAALYVALKTLGIKEGDEVILPSATFTATALAIAQLNATPIFADIDPLTWTIDPLAVEQKITDKTRAIIAVHLYGNPCNMEALQALARKNNLFLLEDAAQAHGATLQNRKVGSFGDIACFSFYPSKNLGAMGDAGAITFQNEKYLEEANAIRNCGKNNEGKHSYLGFNYRMDPFQACVLNAKLQLIDGLNTKRKEIANQYKTRLKSKKLISQECQPQGERVYHLFVVKADSRKLFVDHLKKHKIGFAFHYLEPVHLQEAYAFLKYKKGDLPQTEDLFEHCVSIPLYPEMEQLEIDRVIEVLNAY